MSNDVTAPAPAPADASCVQRWLQCALVLAPVALPEE